MNINQVLKRRGFVNGVDFLMVDDGGGVHMRWLSSQPMPSAEDLAETWADLVSMAYRLPRKRAYIARLGVDGTFENTVGDVLDAVIRQTEVNRIAAGAEADPDFAEIVAEIAAIKAEFPKQGQ